MESLQLTLLVLCCTLCLWAQQGALAVPLGKAFAAPMMKIHGFF
jgi:hypothetical protein